MKDTCEGKSCPVYKKFKLKEEKECPQYMESFWKPENGSEPKLIKDCCNKRLFLMIQHFYGRLEGVQKSQEQMRNAHSLFAASLKDTLQTIAGEKKSIKAISQG